MSLFDFLKGGKKPQSTIVGFENSEDFETFTAKRDMVWLCMGCDNKPAQANYEGDTARCPHCNTILFAKVPA